MSYIHDEAKALSAKTTGAHSLGVNINKKVGNCVGKSDTFFFYLFAYSEVISACLCIVIITSTSSWRCSLVSSSLSRCCSWSEWLPKMDSSRILVPLVTTSKRSVLLLAPQGVCRVHRVPQANTVSLTTLLFPPRLMEMPCSLVAHA